jgi:hypothetical protein
MAQAFLLGSACLWLVAGARDGRADEPTLAAPWKIFAECRHVVLSQKLALTLLSDIGDPARSAGAWARLEQMIDTEQAQLAADLVVQGLAGESLVTSSLASKSYHDSDLPVGIPDRLPPQVPPEALKAWPLVGVYAQKLRQRETGEHFEIKAAVAPGGRWLTVSVEASQLRIEESRKIPFAELPWGERIATESPVSNELKNKSDFRLRNGEKILLGVHKLSARENTFELFVLQVKASPAGPEPKE